MDDLVTWLRATLDAVEADARSFLELQPDLPDWARLALAEVEAKRRILDAQNARSRLRHGAYINYGTDGRGTVKVTQQETGEVEYLTDADFRERYCETPPPSLVVRLLALPYADQPGYREEWRP